MSALSIRAQWVSGMSVSCVRTHRNAGRTGDDCPCCDSPQSASFEIEWGTDHVKRNHSSGAEGPLRFRLALSFVLPLVLADGLAWISTGPWWSRFDPTVLMYFLLGGAVPVLGLVAMLLIWWRTFRFSPRARWIALLVSVAVVGLWAGLAVYVILFADTRGVGVPLFVDVMRALFALTLGGAASVACGLAWLWVHRLGRPRAPTALDVVPCPACGYDLRGQEVCRCPECGQQFTVGAVVGAALAADESW